MLWMEHDPELKKYMKAIALSNRWDRVILRSLLIGTFVALGTTVGFALLLLFVSQFVGSFRQIPLLDTILEQTKLDLLIENQLKKLNETPSEEQDPDTETPQPKPLTYNSNTPAFSFTYPAHLGSTSSKTTPAGAAYTQFTGNGDGIQALDLFVDTTVTIKGINTQRFINIPELGRTLIYIYEQGAVVNGEELKVPVYYTTIKVSGANIAMVGYGAADLPKLGREVFTNILESIQI